MKRNPGSPVTSTFRPCPPGDAPGFASRGTVEGVSQGVELCPGFCAAAFEPGVHLGFFGTQLVLDLCDLLLGRPAQRRAIPLGHGFGLLQLRLKLVRIGHWSSRLSSRSISAIDARFPRLTAAGGGKPPESAWGG